MKCAEWLIAIAMMTGSPATADYHEMDMDCDEAQVAIKYKVGAIM